MHTRRSILATSIVVGMSLPRLLHAQQSESPADKAMRMREFFFSISPQEAKIKPTAEFPTVFGIIIDWNINGTTLTIVSFADGTSSIYSTAGLEIVGGYAAATSAKNLVREAERSISLARRAVTHLYPSSEMARYFIRTYEGVYMIEEKMSALIAGTSKHNALNAAANQVFSELRIAAEKTEFQREKR